MDLSHLNEPQRKAVSLVDGPMMILAGAGSGKTRTLVSRIQYLIEEKNIPTYHILAMTFSNRAAREMRERLEGKNGEEKFGSLFVTTFHSFCARVLRSEANLLGLSKNFTIYDDSETLSVIKNIMSRRGLNSKEYSPHEFKHYISSLKNMGYFRGAEEFDFFEAKELIDKTDLYFEVYEEYERELHASNATDFGGLITGVLELFARHQKVTERYQKRFKYVLVDEYQDTNRCQFYLILILAKTYQNICVVGDEDQSIYSWRGADINNILSFEKHFSEVKVLKLEQNYRSSKTIIEAASYVINLNTMRKGKSLWTENPQGDAIEVFECLDDRVESEALADKIIKIHRDGASYFDIAIFYRNNSQSRMIEDALRKKQVPYRIIGGIKFYDRKEIKDSLSYMKVVVNPKDSLSLSRVINSPSRGIGAVSLRKIESMAIAESLSLYEGIKKIVENQENYSHLKLSKKVKVGLNEFVELIEVVKKMDDQGESLNTSVEKILEESGYFLQLKTVKSYENLARIDNLKELLSSLRQFEMDQVKAGLDSTFSSYLESVTLDQSSLTEEEIKEGQVALMTVHSSKGLEYDHVFVVGVEENIFPSILSMNEGEDRLEEERRLFYVAMTRAMKKLYLSFCKSRMLWGKIQFQEPSRFVFEIPEEYLKWKKIGKSTQAFTPKGKHFDFGDEYNQDFGNSFDTSEKVYINSSYSDLQSTFNDGSVVEHGLYGKGTVVKSEGSGSDEKVTIKFQLGGTKKFLVKYAPIELV
jgi:DNA helicase-2/ATP-dependent DNA helicase PcrA